MTHLGILLVSEHFPKVSDISNNLDPVLRQRFSLHGINVSRISVFKTFNDEFPQNITDCDAWVVSGSEMIWDPKDPALDRKLTSFIVNINDHQRPVFGINHGEHIVHRTLAKNDEPKPNSRVIPNTIRNPFFHFRERELLYRWCEGACIVDGFGSAVLDTAA